jgi:predicted phage terminase large subunit-like protein
VIQLDRVIQSWDTAAKAGQLNDYSVCTTWALKGDRAYLLDVVRERLEFPALRRRIIDEADRHRAEVVLIEDKGSGTSMLQELSSSGFGKGTPVLPVNDKIVRLAGVTAMIEQGRVYLPHSAVWLQDYVHELCGFPGLKHDDQVDSTSQALAWIREQGNPGHLFHYTRQRFEKMIAFSQHRTVRLRTPDGISHHIGMDGTMIPIGSDRIVWLTEEEARGAVSGGYVRLPM